MSQSTHSQETLRHILTRAVIKYTEIENSLEYRYRDDICITF